ncbi:MULTISPECIES: hypothetical protein [unclassified Microcoleus]|uniref:hypothetical protein n=1 Tax=unclassified Microcoleus TaxID=2642155 RepID=UPI002FD4FF9F
MPSTFECPYCHSRYNWLISSEWLPDEEIEKSTYQCKQCLALFDHRLHLPEQPEEENSIIEM